MDKNKENNPIEEEIYRERKAVDYDTRELTIEYIVDKYTQGIDDDKNELFVPDYQREFVWEQDRQSKFIESIIMGLPLPYIFVAETKEGRLEIVDGSQRIRTMNAFLKDELQLCKLSKLKLINGKIFSELDESRQRKIKNIPIRMVVLTEATSHDAKIEMFDRINRGSDLLKNMEQRKALWQGGFTDFLYQITDNKKFIEATPLNRFLEKRQERQELALRFFALHDGYNKYPSHMGIANYLDDYLRKANDNFTDEVKQRLTDAFERVIDFVDTNFKYKFSKSHNNQVARPYFEAISVGVYLALQERPSLKSSKESTEKWLRTSEFNKIISDKYQTHSPEHLKERIEYVKNKLLILQ